ncbi:MAG: thiolase family protein [Propionibacteriales bacterium]|nr:thiolase family protein [Propionibacteriales bacterium]
MPHDSVYILGLGSTAVARQPERSFTDLTREAIGKALEDAGLDDPDVLDQVWFSSYMMDFWGQRACRGQEVLTPILQEGLLPAGLPIINVEAACASASVAFHGAWKHVLSGQSEVALAVGVEKMNDPNRPTAEALDWIGACVGSLDPDAYWQPYLDLAAELGTTFDVGTGSFAMHCYALWAKEHMNTYGTTVEQIAAAAAKNHTNAVDNPRAQYRFPLTVEQVLDDRVVSAPLTRAMCAPTGDAAAAVIVCSGSYLDRQPEEVRRRALRISGHALGGGHRGVRLTGGDRRRAPIRAAQLAYRMAGISPDDLDLVELHDATSFAEIHLVEDLGLCEPGKGGIFTASGESQRDGRIPVNASGGLVSRGHPIGATGIVMLHEAALQLRGEAGAIQLPDPQVALVENGGGIVGHDVAVCSVTILELS